MPRGRVRWLVVCAALFGSALVTGPPSVRADDSVAPATLGQDSAPQQPVPQQVAAGATSFVPIGPCRLLDSRETPGLGRVSAGHWRIAASRCRVPAGASAVVVTLTATDVTVPGFITAWPSGLAKPTTSNVNFGLGNIVANAAFVPLSSGGSFDVATHGRAQVVVDVTGYFNPTAAPVASGRYERTSQSRLIDTRVTGGRGSGNLSVALPKTAPPDVQALVVTLTSVDAAGPGFMTAHPAGSDRPTASMVNTDELNRTRASLAVIPVTSRGFVIYRHTTTDVIVDVWGWFTGPSAPPSGDGLYVPSGPTRVWDSRLSHDPVHARGTIERKFAPGGAGDVVANVTAVEMTDAGFVTVHTAGVPRPNVSSLNYRWRDPVAALTVSPVSTRGTSFYSHAGAHLVVDIAGWFTGAPTAANGAIPANRFPAANTPVVMVSDSAFAGIRWNGALNWLQGARFNARLESCRRILFASCRGREGYAPPTAVQELERLGAWTHEMAVMATGYNDWHGLFAWGVDAFILEARRKGIERVVWLTYRENVSYVSPQAASNRQSFIANNAYLRSVVDSGRYPEMIIADWNTYSYHRPAWFTADGVHLTTEGARQAAMYTSRKLAFLERRPCPAAIGGVTAPGGWCADPDATGPP